MKIGNKERNYNMVEFVSFFSRLNDLLRKKFIKEEKIFFPYKNNMCMYVLQN